MYKIDKIFIKLSKKIKDKPFFLKVLYGLFLLPVLLIYSLINASYLLFSNPYKSFTMQSNMKQNGTYQQSYHEHVRLKKRARLFSFGTTSLSVLAVIFSIFFANLLTTSVFNYNPQAVQAADEIVSCNSTVLNQAALDVYVGDNVEFTDGGDGICVLAGVLSATSVTVGNGVTLTHDPNGFDKGAGVYAGVEIVTTGNFTIESGASINANEKGCQDDQSDANGSGPDDSNLCATSGYGSGMGYIYNSGVGGGAYGGFGGDGSSGYFGGLPFSASADTSFINPILFGASGGTSNDGQNNPGGSGGGLVKLNISGILSNDGLITVNGEAGFTNINTRASGGGSGGAINITAAKITGTGTFSAVGGDGADADVDGGGGSGGRIVLQYTDDTTKTFTSSDFIVTGGLGPDSATAGNKGTVYLKDTNSNIVNIFHGHTYSDTDFSETIWTVDSSATNQYFDTNLASDASPSVTATHLTLGGTFSGNWEFASLNFSASSSFSILDNTSLSFDFPGNVVDFNIPDSDDQIWNNFTFTGADEGNFTINDAVGLDLNSSTITSNITWDNLTSLDLDSSSSINATEKGCQDDISDANGSGPNDSNVCSTSGYGAGIGSTTNAGSGGAGHGGHGGTGSTSHAGGATFDSETNPVLLGASGGTDNDNIGSLGGAGGGLVIIDVANTFNYNGSIYAQAGAGATNLNTRASGGGSGGIVNITADDITGTTGTISVDGGAGADADVDGGGGGGGRISLTGVDSTSFISGWTAADKTTGGTATGTAVAGSDGTLYTLFYTAPSTPSISNPVSGYFNQDINLTITSSAYSADVISHTFSDWKVTTDSNGSNIVWSKDDDASNLESITVNTTQGTFSGDLAGETTLANNTVYYAFVRHANSAGDSSWSTTGHSFTTNYNYPISTQSWPFTTSGNYTYNNSYLDVSSGLSQLDDLGAGTYRTAGLNGFSHRQPITFTNSGSELTNYQIELTIPYDSDMKIDFDDIRFTSSDGTTEIDYWRESFSASTSATFWVEVPTVVASGDTSIYVYYGNASAVTTSSGADTFVFFDDFNGALSDQWNTTGAVGNWSIVSHQLQCADDTTDFYYIEPSVSVSTSNKIIEVTAKTVGGTKKNFYALTHFESANSDWLATGSRVGNNDWVVEKWDISFGETTLISASETINESQDYDLEIIVKANDEISLDVDGVNKINSYDATTADFNHRFAIGSDDSDTHYDDIRIREYTASEPSTSFGAEEEAAYSDVQIVSVSAPTYVSLTSFTETLGGNNAGSVKYQLSNNGTNWYYYNGSTWTAVSDDSLHSNTAAQVNGYLPDFSTDVGTGDLYFKAFLISNGSQKVELDSLSVGYDAVPAAPESLSLSGVDVALSGTATATAGDMLGTHQSTSWKIQTGSDCSADTGVVWSSISDAVNKVSISYSGLAFNTNYYLCVANHNESGQGDWASSLFTSIANQAPTYSTPLSVTSWNEDNDSATYNLNSNFSDSEGHSLTYSVVSDPANITANITANNINFTPEANWNGTQIVTIKADDGHSGTVTSSNISLTVNSVNDTPAVANDSDSVDEDITYNGDLSHTDVDEDAVTYSVVAQTSHGTVTLTNTATGIFNYVPTENFNGTDSFTYKVNDGTIDSNTATFTITVNSVNDTPAVIDASDSVDEDVTYNGDLSHTDVDEDAVTYSVVAQASHGVATITDTATGVFNYVPADNYNGADSFTYKVNDGTIDSNTATFTITVNSVNDTPIVSSTIVDQSTNEDINITDAFDLDDHFTDVDTGDTCTYSIVDDPTYVTISIDEDNIVSFILDVNYNGLDTVVFRCTDQSSATVDSNTVNIVVSAVNDTPTASFSGFTIDEDSSGYLDGTGSSDVEGDLTYLWTEISDSGDGCTISSSVSSKPLLTTLNKESSWSCVYSLKVTDEGDASDTTQDTITIIGENDPPAMISITDKTITAGEELTFAVGANDNDSVVSLAASDPESDFSDAGEDAASLLTDHGNNTATVNWDTDINQDGTYVMSVIADDANSTDITLVNITVDATEAEDTNNSPVCTNDLPNISFYKNTTITPFDLDDYCTDPDGDVLSYSVVGADLIDTSISEGEVSMTSIKDGEEAIYFTAMDPDGATDSTNASIIIVSELQAEDIAYSLGTSKGEGIVTIVDINGDTIASWTAFSKGGAVPRLEGKKVFVIKKKTGTTIHAYNATGKLLDKQRISKKVHWRKIATGNLDNNKKTFEIVTATKRGSTIYMKLYRFKNNKFRLIKRTKHKHIRKEYRVRINDSKKKFIMVLDKKGKIMFTWKPLIK